MVEVTDATLTKIQKNEIFKLIVQYGPSPSDFQWTETQQEELGWMSPRPYKVSVLTHRPTGYYCIFGAHSVTISPGITRKVEDYRREDRSDYKENACGKWLFNVKMEVDAPDLWASIFQEKSLPAAVLSATIDNRLFTAAEHILIATKLDEIKGYLLEGQQFDAEQAEAIEREFAYLKESSRRLGRKDWLNNLLGGLVGLAIGLTLDPEKAKGLLRLAGSVFQSLWGIGQNYLP